MKVKLNPSNVLGYEKYQWPQLVSQLFSRVRTVINIEVIWPGERDWDGIVRRKIKSVQEDGMAEGEGERGRYMKWVTEKNRQDIMHITQTPALRYRVFFNTTPFTVKAMHQGRRCDSIISSLWSLATHRPPPPPLSVAIFRSGWGKSYIFSHDNITLHCRL